MPATAYTSTYYQVYGQEQVSISALPMSAQTYTWDFRQAIISAEEAVPAPSADIYSRQIIGWLSADIPNLSVRTSAYNLAGGAAKLGSFAWVNQSYVCTGGFLNYTKQYLGQICCFDQDDTVPGLDGLSDYSYFLLPLVNGVAADKILISLSGGLVEGATLSVTWCLQRNPGFGGITNPVISYAGTQL